MHFKAKAIKTEDKNKFYQLLSKQVQGLLSLEDDFIANAANLSSLLFQSLDNINWVGFYLLKHKELVLGPFHGQVACTRIPLNQGVCGTAFSQKKTLRVADVNKFKGHIACDSASASEIVIPLKHNEKYFAVLDIDSPIPARFDEKDQLGLEQIATIFCQSIKL